MQRLRIQFLKLYLMILGGFAVAAVISVAMAALVLVFSQPLFPIVFDELFHLFAELDQSIGMQYVLVCLLFFLVAVAFLGFYVISRIDAKVVDPIEELNAATRHICAGEYDTEIIGAENRELNELCAALDEMRLRLKEKAAAEAAALADRNLLIANISHDMRTPITTIRGYLQAIDEGVAATPEQIQTCYDHIRAKTEFLEFLAADMAEFSDQESGRLRYTFEDVELCGFLRDMAEEYSDEAESRGFVFSSFIPEGPVFLRADRYRLQRVMQNLLSNAMKYNKPGGAITVSLEVSAPYIYLCVSDSGIGVGGDSLKKVFDSFYREDASRGNISGHGLGLAIARQIVEAHKGKIWMQSKENEGTQVFLCFPLIDREGWNDETADY